MVSIDIGGSAFLTTRPEVIAASKDGVAWTEGPLWLDDRLLFSDTVEGSLWEYSNVTGLRRVLRNAGGCAGPTASLADRPLLSRFEEELRKDHTYCPDGQLEPGPNGNAFDNRTGLVIGAQHGGRRVVRRDPATLEVVDVLASSHRGVPLNSPNDVAVHPADGAIHFTDPYYGFLEIAKLPLGDHSYTSDKSALGYAGVYRVAAPKHVGGADPQSPTLLTTELERPNGIAFEPSADASGRHAMWVSECCQGHARTCPANTARWVRFLPAGDAERADGRHYVRDRMVSWSRAGGGGGCADGFAMLARPHRPTLLIGACPMGVCVIDTSLIGDAAMIQHVEFTHRTSNVAVGADNYVYVTGEGHLWRLPLARDMHEVPWASHEDIITATTHPHNAIMNDYRDTVPANVEYPPQHLEHIEMTPWGEAPWSEAHQAEGLSTRFGESGGAGRLGAPQSEDRWDDPDRD